MITCKLYSAQLVVSEDITILAINRTYDDGSIYIRGDQSGNWVITFRDPRLAVINSVWRVDTVDHITDTATLSPVHHIDIGF